MAVQDELAWFESNRAFIAQNYGGQFVVIKDKEVKGAYPNYDSAYKAATQQFGAQGGFAIKQALDKEPVQKVV